MAKFSRRQFMQFAGVTLLAGHLPAAELLARPAASVPELTAQHGRVLLPAAVHAQPRADARVVSQLWPDSLISIVDVRGSWYRAGGGFVPRSAVQPVLLSQPARDLSQPACPFWAEVSGPVAAVRHWCAADAPLVTRIGHGGTGKIVAALSPGEPNAPFWYALAGEDHELLGWTQAAHWQPAPSLEQGAALSLEIARSSRQLTVFVESRPALRAAIAAGAELKPGTYPLRRTRVAGPPLALVEYGQTLHGAPWQLSLNDQYSLTGAYWHNRFGDYAPGPAIQVPPFLARWLYAHAGADSMVYIR